MYDDVTEFWMEEETPTGKAWHLVYENCSLEQEYNYLLSILHKFKIIECGALYEQHDMIRIRRA